MGKAPELSNPSVGSSGLTAAPFRAGQVDVATGTTAPFFLRRICFSQDLQLLPFFVSCAPSFIAAR